MINENINKPIKQIDSINQKINQFPSSNTLSFPFTVLITHYSISYYLFSWPKDQTQYHKNKKTD